MSIPSIRFAPANRRPQAILNSKPNSKLKFDLSSSYYSYSDSDDIPTLETLNKQSNQPALLSSASLESDDYDYPAKDEDWTAKRRNPPINNNKPSFQNNNIRNEPVQKKPNKEIQSKDSDNEIIFEYNETNITVDNNNNVSQIPNQNNQTESIQDHQNNLPNQPQQIEPKNESNYNSSFTQEMITTSINNVIKDNQDSSDKLPSFFVFKQNSSFPKSKTKYRMEENSRVIFFASESKDFKGKSFTITSNADQSLETVGYVHINSNHEIFTIATNEELFNDDRKGELCGIEFDGEIVQQTPSSKNKYKRIRIVFPKNGKPYYPISRRKSLSKIVQICSKKDKNMVTFSQGSNNEDSTPNIEDSSLKLERFNFFESTTPSDNSQDGKSEELNKFLMNPSSKNFIFRNKEGKTIFIFLKIASGSYSASFCPPITPIIAFGISIAVISSS